MDIFDHTGEMRSTTTFRDAHWTTYHGDAQGMAMDK